LINDPDVNAIYIATPPSSHEAYAIAAIDAGKARVCRKANDHQSCYALSMHQYADRKNVKLSVAHYRRAQPLFKKIQQLLA
jgi:predicted dehydrogenase